MYLMDVRRDAANPMYLMDPHNDVPGKKRSILWIKEGLQSTLKPFPTRRRESPLTVRILSSNSHGRFQRLADPKLILRHDPEVVLVAFDQPHDLEVEVTDELADGFPFPCLHVLLLHNVVGDWAPAILLATHPDITCIPLSSSFFYLKSFHIGDIRPIFFLLPFLFEVFSYR